MFFKIAIRNLLRNKRRTLIILSSIIIGVSATLIYDSINAGMITQMLVNQINTYYSHIQIHKKGFNDNRLVTSYIPDYKKIEDVIKNQSYIKHYSKRVIAFGMLSSANSSAGISMIGIEPDKEKKVSDIHRMVVEGRYPSGKSNEILISKRMADKLEVTLGDKVVAMAADTNGKVNSELFRIVGIYRSHTGEFDKVFVYVPIENARNILGIGDNVTEISLITENADSTFSFKKQLNSALNNSGYDISKSEILTYQESLAMIMYLIDIWKQTSIIIYLIIALAVLFGVINTMLMSVFERVNEIGVLMSIGMKNSGIFKMIVLEAFMLGLVGTVAGFIIGILIFLPLSHNGINLGMYSESMSSFGLNNIIYPELNLMVIINSLFIMPLATALGAFYPARKAIKLQPTDAMRYV
ncbi:MAG: ABC transporter permease [Ignavibacteriae bacterium]|nr:ABC transporter permease [Ignavibacteriota bacterium]